ncbi:SPLICING REGULATORY GLUTAMINE/LYSINE-RICH PROTEIN 1 [Salix koriyanagi]|uniref:SPLICING REGULATORY GLUTAMINE/LYSINE-RICH PROTEIN 1 n=1 Tax=Salix koriyanagi TaxID=2511006 RepID=A0A9Q0PN69_9ROSI|nr:SPLICING REGULATORY GLUTAMINE/LYSINE-RICH PROTEIN 1 [Salix koriyanagi]
MGHIRLHMWCRKEGITWLLLSVMGKLLWGVHSLFSLAHTSTGGLLGMAPATTFPNLVNQTMPNMPNYSANVSGAFPALLGMTPGIASSASGGAILPGVGASLGEVCREYLYGRCAKTDCKLSHPPQSLLMTLLAPTTSMGTLSMVPMAPSAAAMAAAQAIVAAKALQAHAAQLQAQAQSAKDSSGSPDKARKEDALKKTLHVSNLSPLLTVEQLKQLFSIEYLKPEEATAALALNNMDVGGRPLNVEMAKSLPPKPILNSSFASSSLPMMMQQAVAMQQMQFQQALLMQQTMNAQQAANKAATMKSATELAAAKAAEISKKLKDDGFVTGEGETKAESNHPRLEQGPNPNQDHQLITEED